jgi:hypothetical protein
MRGTKIGVRLDDALIYFKSKKAAKTFADLINEALVCFEDSKLFRDEKVKIDLKMLDTGHAEIVYRWGAQIERDEIKYGK